MNFCILSAGASNLWVVIFTFMIFSAILVITAVSLITKATEKNKKPNAKKIIILTTINSFFFSFLFFVLLTRSLFIYEISPEDYGDLRNYVKNYNKRDVVMSRIGTKIILCKRNKLSEEMLDLISEAREAGYVTYEDLICFAKKSCEK